MHIRFADVFKNIYLFRDFLSYQLIISTSNGPILTKFCVDDRSLAVDESAEVVSFDPSMYVAVATSFCTVHVAYICTVQLVAYQVGGVAQW